MADKLKTYEEFTGSKQTTPEGIKAYTEYIKSLITGITTPKNNN